METVNFAKELDTKELNIAAQDATEAFKEYTDSRSGWEEKHATWKKLYFQIEDSDPKKVKEYQGSKVSMPILTEAVNLFQARGYKAFFPTRDFIQANSIEAESSDAMKSAERVAKHMTYQLTVENKHYRQDKSAMLLAAAIHGSDFTKTYFDPVRKKNIVERVRAEDLVVPYGSGPRYLEDIEDKFQVVWMTANRAKFLYKTGYFISEPEAYTGGGDGALQQADRRVEGIEPGNDYGNDRGLRCILERHCLMDIDNDGIAEPYIVHICRRSQKVLRISIRYEVDEYGEATDYKQAVEYYNHYKYLENPDGFYGLGLGYLLGELNLATNQIIREVINAGELANVGNMSGFISERLGIKGGDLSLKLGKFLKIPKSVEDIKSSMLQFSFPGPNPSYVQTLQHLEGIAQRLGNTTDAATGDIQKVMQPLSIMTLLESTLQMPTAVLEQMAIAFEGELEKLYKLNQKYLKTPQDFAIEGYKGTVFPEDYSENIRVFPIIDPKMITKQQKIAKAQALYQFAQGNPFIMQNPEAFKEVTKRMLVAMETEDIELILPGAQEPKRVDDPNQENFMFMLPDNQTKFDVFPEQNHQEHMAIHSAFMQSPEFASMPEPQQMAVMMHMQKHQAFDYGQKTGAIDGQGQPQDMASERNDPAGILAANGGIQPGGGNMEPGIDNRTGAAVAGATGGLVFPDEPVQPGIIGLADIGLIPPA